MCLLAPFLKVSFWTQPVVRSALSSVAKVTTVSGWSAASAFALVAAAFVPKGPGPLDLGTPAACAAATTAFAAFSVAGAPGDTPGLYIAAGTPDADRKAMLAGTHRASFVAVVRETQVGSELGM